MGIGLAIPSNLAKQTLQTLHEQSRPTLLKLGASAQTLTPPLRHYFQWTGKNNGALVTKIEKNSLAEHLGLLVQDIIVKVNDRSIDNVAQMGWILGSLSDESTLHMHIFRNGKIKTKTLPSIAEWHARNSAPLDTSPPPTSFSIDQPKLPAQKRLHVVSHHPDDPKGVFVTHVWHRPYLFDGLHPKDLILEVNQKVLDQPQDFYHVLDNQSSQPILLKIQRRQLPPFFITLHP